MLYRSNAGVDGAGTVSTGENGPPAKLIGVHGELGYGDADQVSRKDISISSDGGRDPGAHGGIVSAWNPLYNSALGAGLRGSM